MTGSHSLIHLLLPVGCYRGNQSLNLGGEGMRVQTKLKPYCLLQHGIINNHEPSTGIVCGALILSHFAQMPVVLEWGDH